MSLEALISGLTAAIQANTAALQGQASAPAPQAQAQQAPPQTFGAPQPTANGMPGAPFGGGAASGAAPQTFGVPQQQAAPAVPFSDLNGLVAYAVSVNEILEKKQPGRGGWIQQIINQLGHTQANEIRLDQYPQFYAALEQMKAQP